MTMNHKKLYEKVFTSLAEARTVIERWRQDYNQVRPHSAQNGLMPEAVRGKVAGDRLRDPPGFRRSPATNIGAELL